MRDRVSKRLGRGSGASSTVLHRPAPAPVDYLWSWFWDILAGVPASGMAPAAIGWPDLVAWSQIMNVRLEPWEARLIVQLGTLRASVLASKKTEVQ